METVQHIKLVQALPSASQSDGANSSEALVSDGALILIPLCFLSAWAIAIVIAVGIPKGLRRQVFSPPRPKVPCRNCQFFSVNPYLQCAVHPSTVLTGKAADCSDFRSRHEGE